MEVAVPGMVVLKGKRTYKSTGLVLDRIEVTSFGTG